MANLQLRGEYVRNILAGYDKMESDTRKPENALQAAQAKIIPAEFIMAHLCASIMWLAKRHSKFFVEALCREIFTDLMKVDKSAEEHINNLIERASKNGNP